MRKRVIIYARVSTKEQNVDMQLLDLTQYAEARGFEIVKKYVDIGSGTKDDRINYQKMLDDVRKRKTDIVLVWKFDRYARSTKELVNALEEFNRLGVDFISFKESLDTSSPAGRVLFHIISAFSSFEAEIIRERVVAGMEKAKARGVKLGRPCINSEIISGVKKMHQLGYSRKEIISKFNIAKSTYHSILTR